ncbi:hypothetical protein BN159_8418 [Streptomyces davaonensis JCM 4913]|uniref:Uncharacterized protein n=1 Tax=Streptomyces davaonensis (strain DSM 101723 / JCM 4913 / KCC S-0913 / 768) TaxID=1214101 RepID=K4R937_STRDJ|nr:DUF6087 family protein [Streptomyces davaonensis]CCK32796.1 hypothetical protein BN159_8418 [Streptomyces davaonensis JCM 4913]
MGKHSRPGPPNQPSRATPRIDPANPLAPYEKRRRPPMDVWRRHRPLHRGGGHLHPEQPRALEEWNGFSYEPAGTAPNLAQAQRWANEQTTGQHDESPPAT